MILRRLPGDSAFSEAQLDDPDLAEAVLEQSETGGSRGPRVSDYGPVVSRLDQVIDRLSGLYMATIKAHGGKPPRLRSQPRPVTAADQARRERSKRKHAEIVADVKAAQRRWAQSREGGDHARPER